MATGRARRLGTKASRLAPFLLALILVALAPLAALHRTATAAAPCHPAASARATGHDAAMLHAAPAHAAAPAPATDPDAPATRDTGPDCCVSGACPSLAGAPPPLPSGPRPPPGALIRHDPASRTGTAGVEVPPSLPPPRRAA